MDQDIESFLARFGLEARAAAFRENEFDTVRDLHDAEVESLDLAELGVAALKKRKLLLKAVTAASAAASSAVASSPTPAAVLQPEPEQEPSPAPAADRCGTGKKAKSVCTAARIHRLSQPKSQVPAAAAPARQQPTPTGAAAAFAAAELLHGTPQERREQQQREMQERLEFQRSLKQVSLLGRFPAEHGDVALTSAEQLDREREERAWARQEEWVAKQAQKKSRKRSPRTAAGDGGGGGSGVASTRRLEELAKPTTTALEVWRAQKQEEGYAAVAKRSIHAPDKQQGVDVSDVVGRLYSPSQSEQSQPAASATRDLPAWGSPSASQPRRVAPARADRLPDAAVRRRGKAKCEPSLAEREALTRLQRSTRSSLANDKSRGRCKAKSRPLQSHQLNHTSNRAPQVPMMRVKGRTKLRTPSVIEEAEPPEIAKLHSARQHETEVEVKASADDEGSAEAEAKAEAEAEPEPEPEPEPKDAAKGALAVEVPSGVHAGDTISIEMPDGQEVDVEIPEGLNSGDEFEIELDGVEVGTVEE
jgi:hypothetical protein